MKKITAILSVVLLLSSQSMTIVNAEDNALKTFADSLGADTDSLKIINYIHDDEHPVYKESYEQYQENCTNVEKQIAYLEFSKRISSGMCLGISAIEILAHNGVLKPSDIKSGAEKLNEITYDKDSDLFMTAYAAIQGHFEFNTYIRYLTSMTTQQEQAKKLIEVAEKCMAENKYFLIKYDDRHSIQHAVAGIGIKRGEWQFNDSNYDICILTLDSNIVSKETGLSMPFHEQGCVYINSETLDYYVPVYDFKSGEDGICIVAIDDDALLSYKGIVDNNGELDNTISELNWLRFKYNGDVDYNVDVTEYNGDVHEIKQQINELKQVGYLDYYATGKRFEAECRIIDETNKKTPHMELINRRSKIVASCAKDVEFIADENDFSITPLNDGITEYNVNIIYNEGYYSTHPYYKWALYGDTDSYINLTMKDKGLLLSSDSVINTLIEIDNSEWGTDEKTSKEFEISSVNDVLLKNNNNDAFEFYIDPDGDNEYDKKVEKGDVNFDGIIDGRDASDVLNDYAMISANKANYSHINSDYNNDGVIDGRDASEILAYYAKSSVAE